MKLETWGARIQQLNNKVTKVYFSLRFEIYRECIKSARERQLQGTALFTAFEFFQERISSHCEEHFQPKCKYMEAASVRTGRDSAKRFFL